MNWACSSRAKPYHDAHELLLQPGVEMGIGFVQQQHPRSGSEYRHQNLQRLMEPRSGDHHVQLPGERPVAIGGVDEPVDVYVEGDAQDALREQVAKQLEQRLPARFVALPQLPEQIAHHLSMALQPHPFLARGERQVFLARQEPGKYGYQADVPLVDGFR